MVFLPSLLLSVLPMAPLSVQVPPQVPPVKEAWMLPRKHVSSPTALWIVIVVGDKEPDLFKDEGLWQGFKDRRCSWRILSGSDRDAEAKPYLERSNGKQLPWLFLVNPKAAPGAANVAFEGRLPDAAAFAKLVKEKT